MIEVSNSVGWTVFLPTIWCILLLYVYIFIHIRKVVRIQDVLIGCILLCKLLDTFIWLPIVIDYVINVKYWIISACRGVIWFSQFTYLTTLGLLPLLLMDMHVKLESHLTKKIFPIPYKFPLYLGVIFLVCLWILCAILAGVLPALQWTYMYRGDPLACTYLPFQQNFDYTIGELVFTALIMFFCIMLGILIFMTARQVHVMASLSGQPEVVTQDLALRRRSNRRLVNELRVTFSTFIIVFGLSLFPAFVVNLHGLSQPTWSWEPLVIAYFWMQTLEALLLPIVLFCVTSRYRHPLSILFDRILGSSKPDHVCTQEVFDRRMMRQLKLGGGAISDTNAPSTSGPYSRETLRTNPIRTETDAVPMSENRSQPNENVSTSAAPIQQSIHHSIEPIKTHGVVNESPCITQIESGKRNAPANWLDSPKQKIKGAPPPVISFPDVEINSYESNAQVKNPSHNPKETNEYFVPSVSKKNYSEHIPKSSNTKITKFNGDLNDDIISVKENEEVKEKTMIFYDDKNYSPTSELTQWDDYSSINGDSHTQPYSNRGDTGYNSNEDPLKIHKSQYKKDSHASSVDSFWLSDKEIAK